VMAPSPAARSSSELVLGFGASVGAGAALDLGFGASAGAGAALVLGFGASAGAGLLPRVGAGAGPLLPCGGAGPDLSRPTRGPSP
jgi:hypothetical protein